MDTPVALVCLVLQASFSSHSFSSYCDRAMSLFPSTECDFTLSLLRKVFSIGWRKQKWQEVFSWTKKICHWKTALYLCLNGHSWISKGLTRKCRNNRKWINGWWFGLATCRHAKHVNCWMKVKCTFLMLTLPQFKDDPSVSVNFFFFSFFFLSLCRIICILKMLFSLVIWIVALHNL